MAMGILFVPLYIKFLGIESYGVIGFFASLQAALFLLDLGLSTTFSREMARIAPTLSSNNNIRNSLSTFSGIYWVIAIIAGALFMALSPLFADHWLKADHTPVLVIRNATILMGISIIVRWPGTIYSGGINGLQKQVIINVVTVVMSTIRGGGVVVLLWLVSPTLTAFFLWQIGCNLAQTIIYAVAIRYELRNVPGKGRFDWNILKLTWKFSAGMLGINILATLLIQTDKILLSKLVSLEQFGYYALAGSVAGILYAVISPITGALFPRFTELAAFKDEKNLSTVFHLACQAVSLAVFPIWGIMTFFPNELLFVWTNNHSLANNAGPVLAIIATGNLLNLMMHMPYNIQLAYGYTKLTMIVNAISVGLLIPLIFIFVHLYGIKGGAFSLVILNSGYILIAAPFIYRKYLINEKWSWYFTDILRFALPCIGTVLIAKYCKQFIPESRFISLIVVSITVTVSLGIMIAFMPSSTRSKIGTTIAKMAH